MSKPADNLEPFVACGSVALTKPAGNPDAFFPRGSVVLVGAGPGDPDLLTLGAMKVIQVADSVVYDSLVSPEIQALIPKNCEMVFAGKRGGRPSTRQADISETLVRLARENKRVVRLKGGDPFMFGRGGEEACCLVREQIPFRVIPGITAGVAGPAYAGIPITHRGINANVGFFTGHEQMEEQNTEGEATSTMDWEAIGQSFPVLVLYMAMKNIGFIAKRLIQGGRSPETPVAFIRWATTSKQATRITTLKNAQRDVVELDLKPPAIIVIGEVVNFRKSLAWFTDHTLERAADT
ncbi:MAG: uroporphyrinogen-III C-methyltransferase [Magnetococcus sp. DMHC-1]|nr:uroporphyrinogen-III C-methyltransferase [Magnetococcales bacterium]